MVLTDYAAPLNMRLGSRIILTCVERLLHNESEAASTLLPAPVRETDSLEPVPGRAKQSVADCLIAA